MSFMGDDYLATKKKWQQHDRRVIKEIFKAANAPEESDYCFCAFTLIGSILLAALIVFCSSCNHQVKLSWFKKYNYKTVRTV